MEIWKDVCGYSGYYIVSNLGDIIALEREIVRSDGVHQLLKRRVKKKTLDKDGYETVKLSRDGVTKKYFVHRIVAEVFVDGFFDGADVNHKDSNRANNKSDNLEWISHRDNVAISVENGTHISRSDLTGRNNPNYGNHKLREVYANDRALSRMKQGRRGGRNGRSVRVQIVGDKCTIFDSISECASYLIDNGITKSISTSSVSSNISKAVASGAKYLGLIFKYV